MCGSIAPAALEAIQQPAAGETLQTFEVQRLIATVRRHGGRYYNADTVSQLQAAYTDIDALEKGLLSTKVYSQNTPAYSRFVLAALCAVAVAFTLCAIPTFTNLT